VQRSHVFTVEHVQCLQDFFVLALRDIIVAIRIAIERIGVMIKISGSTIFMRRLRLVVRLRSRQKHLEHLEVLVETADHKRGVLVVILDFWVRFVGEQKLNCDCVAKHNCPVQRCVPVLVFKVNR